MSDQQYRVIADRDKGDDPQWGEVQSGDRVWFSGPRDNVDRIERPVPAVDEPQKPELVTLHLYRDTCVGGLFLSERELDRTLHEHVEALTIRRDRLPAPSLPTREQIAETLYHRRHPYPTWQELGVDQNRWLLDADAVLALLQKGAEHEWPAADDGSDLTWRERNGADRG